jgi:hypothetical protein
MHGTAMKKMKQPSKKAPEVKVVEEAAKKPKISARKLQEMVSEAQTIDAAHAVGIKPEGLSQAKKADAKKQPDKFSAERVMLTPEMAMALLEHNKANRPIKQPHVDFLASQMAEGKWVFNGRAIGLDTSGGIVDGQHRLWAVCCSGVAIDTLIVRGLTEDAFTTIDTNQVLRSAGDTVALAGELRYRNVVAGALQWLLRGQRGTLLDYRNPRNKLTNEDVFQAIQHHPQMMSAAEKAATLKREGIGPVPVVAFVYYLIAARNIDLANHMIAVMRDPSGTPTHSGFFRLRMYFLHEPYRSKDPILTIAYMIKATNAEYHSQKVNRLVWRGEGSRAEPFPTLEIPQTDGVRKR